MRTLDAIERSLDEPPAASDAPAADAAFPPDARPAHASAFSSGTSSTTPVFTLPIAPG